MTEDPACSVLNEAHQSELSPRHRFREKRSDDVEDNAEAAARAPYTDGWFQVAWSKELAAGQVRSSRFFGRDLVLFREEQGTARAVDAHCPHLGAHLGVGGKVVGDCIRCPFHGFRFDGAGSCTHIPYADKIPARLRLFSWSVVERDGMIFVWHDHARQGPTRPLPGIDGFHADDWTEFTTYEMTARAGSLELLENAIGSPHSRKIQGSGAAQFEVLRTGPVLELKQPMAVPLFGVQVPATLHAHMSEPGFHTLRLEDLPITAALVVSSITPIDEATVSHRLSIALKRRGTGPLERLLFPLLRAVMARRMMATVQEDAPFWENKVFRASPGLGDGDGPIMLLRRWYAAFAPEVDAGASGAPLIQLGRSRQLQSNVVGEGNG